MTEHKYTEVSFNLNNETADEDIAREIASRVVGLGAIAEQKPQSVTPDAWFLSFPGDSPRWTLTFLNKECCSLRNWDKMQQRKMDTIGNALIFLMHLESFNPGT
jgi:hypothetical protein